MGDTVTMEDRLDDLESRTIRRYGWKPSGPLAGEALADVSGLAVLAEVDPRADMPPIFDQGQLGSCTANATCGLFQYDGILDEKDPGPLSRLFTYYGERKIEGVLGQGDTGAFGHDAFTVAKSGIPPESAWAYDISTFEGPVPQVAVAEEDHYRLTKPVKALTHNELAIKRALSNRQAVAIGFVVYESFESGDVARDGIVPMPTKGEKVLGGHEVDVVGYLKDEPMYALCRNSWGEGWGIDGYFLMPWAYLMQPSLASDFRTIQRPAGK